MKVLSVCEIASREVLPSIRACIAIILLEKGYSLHSVSKILGVSPAAVINYKKRKRGKKLLEKILVDKEYRRRVERIANMMVENDSQEPVSERVRQEICSLCKRIREREGLFEELNIGL